MPAQPPKMPWRRGTAAAGPLTSICVPQDAGRRTSSTISRLPSTAVASDGVGVARTATGASDAIAESVKKLSVPVVLDTCAQDETSFDLMEIQLTVYGLTGIVASKKDNRKKTKKESRKASAKNSDMGPPKSGPSRLFSKRQQSSQQQQPPSASTSTSSTTLEAISNSVVGTTTSHDDEHNKTSSAYDMPIDDGVPITALVSLRRNAISSSTCLETFLPSMPLAATSALRPGWSYRYQASWMTAKAGPVGSGRPRIRSSSRRTTGSSDADDEIQNSRDACTFRVTRAMRREGYRPGLSIDDVGNYACQTLDLQVYVGHRHEMVALGTASLVVTGDEEGEHMMKVPVRPSAAQATSNGKGRKEKSMVSYFTHDPQWGYVLEENSTLRVGVKVVPVPTGRDENVATEIPSRSKNPRHRSTSTTKDPYNVGSASHHKDVIIELEDEAALLAQLCRTDDESDKKEPKNHKKKKSHASTSSVSTSSSSDSGARPANHFGSHACVGVGVDATATTISPGLALMATLLPAGMLCVSSDAHHQHYQPSPAAASASCLDHAVQPSMFPPPASAAAGMSSNPPPPSNKKNLDAFLRKSSKDRPTPPQVNAALPRLSSSLLSTLSGSTDGSSSVSEMNGNGGIHANPSRAGAASFADSHLLSVQRMIEENLRVMHAKLGVVSSSSAPASAPSGQPAPRQSAPRPVGPPVAAHSQQQPPPPPHPQQQWRPTAAEKPNTTTTSRRLRHLAEPVPRTLEV